MTKFKLASQNLAKFHGSMEMFYCTIFIPYKYGHGTFFNCYT